MIVEKKKDGCKGCYYNKSADEMFEELGYEKEGKEHIGLKYIKKDNEFDNLTCYIAFSIYENVERRIL